MADETVDIKIKFDAKTADLNRAIARLAVLEKQVKKLSSGREEAFARRTTNTLSSVTKGWKRSFDFIDAGAKMAGKGLTKFLGLAIKGVLIEMAALGVAMIGIHALFAAGQFIMKTYRGAMQMLAAGAAGAAVAIAAASAAIREQQAAIFAYRGKGAPAFGSAMNQTRMGMRNLQSDASLATLGVDALNKAYGNMSKSMSTSQINTSKGAIKALMDFGSAGQDPAKGLEQVSIVIASLSDKKKGISDVITEAKKLGPEMEQALKKANVKTKKQFQDLLMSGELAKSGGVSGQFDAVNNTLISQLKGYFNRLRGEFADFGDQFLEPLKVAFDRVFGTIRRDLQRVMGAIMFSFGTDGVVDGFADAIEKTSNWLVRMIREYLPGAIGMFDRIGDWFTKFKRGWNTVLDQTRPLIDGARILYKAFEPVWEAIKGGAANLSLFRELLIQNEDSVVEFGDKVAGLIDALSEFFKNLKKMFMDMLPFLNDLVGGLTSVFKMISGIFTLGAGGGLATALAPLFAFGIAGRAMSNVKGRLMPKMGMTTQSMQVTAGTVTIANPSGPMTGSRTTLAGGPGPVPLPPGYRSYPGHGTPTLSSGRGTYGGAYGGPPGGYVIPGMSSPSSVYPSSPISGRIRDIKLNNYARFGESAMQGSRMIVRGSDIEKRRRDNFRDFKMTGRGVGYAMFGQPADPYASPTIRTKDGEVPNPQYNLAKSARFRAEQSLRGRSIDELHSIATGKGVTLAADAKREDIINQILRKKGSVAEFKNDPRNVGIGEGLKNDARRVKLAGIRGLQETKYGLTRAAGAVGGAFGYLNSAGFDREKGEFYDIGSQRQALIDRRDSILKPEGGQKVGFMRRMGAKLDYARDNNRIVRSQTKFGAGVQKFSGSMTGRMGTGMGLGLASQYAPEEMRGAMALGATVAQFNPMLGLGVAGIGGAMKAQGAMKGALSGAAGGAAIGAMFGPQAAAAGAAIGLVFGGIMGAVNKGKENMKQARAAVREQFTALYQTAAGSAGNKMAQNKLRLERGETLDNTPGSFANMGKEMSEKAAQARLDMMASLEAAGAKKTTQSGTGTITYDYHNRKQQTLDAYFKTESAKGLTADQKKAMRKAGGTTIDAVMKEGGLRDDYGRIDDVNAKRIAELSKMTGKSTAELELLAQSIGVNLYDATMDYDTLVGKFTKNLRKNKEQLNAALTDVFLAGANPFKKNREQNEAQYALNQNFRQIGDILRGGGGEAEKMGAVNEGMEQAFSQILSVAGGDAFKAYEMFNKMFRSGEGQGLFAQGAEFAGMDKYFANNPLFQEAAASIDKGVAKESGTQIRGILADRGMTIDGTKLEKAIENMSPEDKKVFLDDLSRYGEQPKGPYDRGFRKSNIETALDSKDPAAALAALNPAFAGIDIGVTDKGAMNELVNASGDMAAALEEFNKLVAGFFSGPSGGPDWWNKGLKITGEGDDMRLMPGDTSSPRGWMVGDTTTSKLSQTMGRHAAMNGQLTGKRTVTSSLRNYALGSPSSDHATGSAYDLTGQNLGQYAKLVHANGGFAEFHGSMANRHLHVVPGPGIGDTTSVRPVSSVATGSGGTTNYYSIEINGANASPEAIANMVMAKLKDQERSNRERR
jgi:hypothetical protein